MSDVTFPVQVVFCDPAHITNHNVAMIFSPGDHSDWLSVDDADVRVAGLRRAVLERGGKEKRRLHILLKCLAVLRHTDVTDDGYGHPQVSTCT